jgi:hypothetical protein
MTMRRPRVFQRWAAEFQSTPRTNPGRISLTWARQVAFVDWPSLTVISSPGLRSANSMLPRGGAARTPPPSRTAAIPNPGLMVSRWTAARGARVRWNGHRGDLWRQRVPGARSRAGRASAIDPLRPFAVRGTVDRRRPFSVIRLRIWNGFFCPQSRPPQRHPLSAESGGKRMFAAPIR